MLISGTITGVGTPDFTDSYGNQYQNITIETTQGSMTGRIACKTPYTEQSIGSQGQWDSEQAQNQQGAYNKFKKHYDKPYQSQQGAPQNPPQAPSQPSGQQNAPATATKPQQTEDLARIRSMAWAYGKDLETHYIIRVPIEELPLLVDSLARIYQHACAATAFIVYGTKPQDGNLPKDWPKDEQGNPI